MPELPEVETIVRDLRVRITGARFGEVRVVRDDLVEGNVRAFEETVSGRTIASVTRRAKNIVIAIDGDRLVINLGMTGRVLVLDPGTPDPAHTGVGFDLVDGRRVIYRDARRFGRLAALSVQAWERRAAGMGPEPLEDLFTTDLLHAATRTSRSPIKPWLMDQRRVVGVGNIYASEALFRAGITPRKAARRLTRRETSALHTAIREVLQEAIDFRGTTLLDYRDAAGEPGEFSRRLRVYDREGEPCVRCGTPIRRIVQGGRSTYFCGGCQR